MPRRQPGAGGHQNPVRDVNDHTAVSHLGGTGDGQKAGTGGQIDHIPLGEGAALHGVAVQAAPLSILQLGQRLVIGVLEGFGSGLLQLGLGRGQEGVLQIAERDQAVPSAQGQSASGQCRGEDQRPRRNGNFLVLHVSSFPSSCSRSSSRWEIM